jgi:hypothetical protein
MKLIGPPLFAPRPDGQYLSSIGTLFPRHELVITAPPLHALQREAFKHWYAGAQTEAGRPAPTEHKLAWEAAESVDLTFARGGVVLIRPELERLDLAFAADAQLQSAWEVPRHRVRFSSSRDPRVRQGLRERGELWRVSTAPTDPATMAETIAHARVAIGAGALYYYNPHTGTRFVTWTEFARLAQLDDGELARQLDEIAQHCVRRNRHGHPEIGFFGVDSLRFGGPNFAGRRFADLAPAELRACYTALVQQFGEAVAPELGEDRPKEKVWQSRMLAVIGREDRDDQAPEVLQGVGAEFAPRVRWLPGGHFEEGEFIFTPVFPKQSEPPDDPELKPLWDPLARGFIANFIREYGNIEYLNLGRIEALPSVPPIARGRRAVYLAEIKVRGELNPRVLFLRVQRWGVHERLEERDTQDKPKELVAAIFETEEYVDYTLDRRLACLQFGMHLPARFNMRRVSEPYLGSRLEYRGRFFPVIYFERDYLAGIATNAVPERKLADPRYALALARLLGKAAAPNIVVGRSRNPLAAGTPGETLFDNGDEILVEASDGLPRELVLVDHSGAFADWRTPSLLPSARAYAGPVNWRAGQVPDPRAFAEAYLEAFREEFVRIQSDYLRRRGAFDGLFKHLPYDEGGSFACRWEHVLKRLRETNLNALASEIRKHIAQ